MKAYCNDFFIDANTGNNAFSFSSRNHRKIWIPALKEGRIRDLNEGKKFVFCEYDIDCQGEECCFGVDSILYDQKRNLYAFDNHNHSFYFIYKECHRKDLYHTMIHIDQHKDARTPSISFHHFITIAKKCFCIRKNHSNSSQIFEIHVPIKRKYSAIHPCVEDILIMSLTSRGFHIAQDTGTEEEIFTFSSEEDFLDFLSWTYTNYVLHVGNFIPPLLEEFQFEYHCIDSSYKMKDTCIEKKGRLILDLDLDFFSKDMDYIPWDDRIEYVRGFIEHSDMITVATSPYFIDFERAKTAIDELF